MKSNKNTFTAFHVAVTILIACSKNLLDQRPLGNLDEQGIKTKAGVEGLSGRSLFPIGWSRFAEFNSSV